MTCIEALTTLVALGPFALLGGIVAGYLYRDSGKATHDPRH